MCGNAKVSNRKVKTRYKGSQSSESSRMRPCPGLFLQALILYGSNRVVTTNFSSIARSMLRQFSVNPQGRE